MYYNDVQGVLVCFDLTDEESFTKLNFWLQDLQHHAPEKIVKILCGLKHDLVSNISMGGMNESLDSRDSEMSRSGNSITQPNRRQVSAEDALQFAIRNKMFYMEASAKTGYNINELFYKMATEVNEMIRKKIIEQQMKQSTSQVNLSNSSTSFASKGTLKLGVTLDDSVEYKREKKNCKC